MASPFPGMDPYLESSARWGGVHAGLIAVLREMLTRQVAPRFFVASEDTVYIIAPDDPGRSYVRPDIYLTETSAVGVPRRDRGQIATPMVIELPQPIEVRYPYLEVRDTANRQVVATIEVLSPINKVAGSKGREDFLRKRQQLLRSPLQWIEIDLLRGGERPPEVLQAAERLPQIKGRDDYYAALHRSGADDKLEAWFVDLRDELPTIAVPLVAPLPDVPLDLQAAVETVYTRYRYDTDIDYTTPPPPPPLDAADAAWAAERIRRWQAGTDTETGA